MLELIVTMGEEYYDDEREEFVYPKEVTLSFEHSLVTLSAWESKWCKPFLSKSDKTEEETLDYIRIMTLTPNVDPEVYNHLTAQHINKIQEYITAPMTATTFSDDGNGKKSREVITSEIIYYWMVALNIPSEYQYWHLNKLLTLIRVCNIKNSPPKKRSRRDILNQYAAMNKARREKLNSRG